LVQGKGKLLIETEEEEELKGLEVAPWMKPVRGQTLSHAHTATGSPARNVAAPHSYGCPKFFIVASVCCSWDRCLLYQDISCFYGTQSFLFL
jgi:hypothetical protein